ncbi:MAG: TetR/AcrR family transcriptional regulator [Acidimicrobiales bacterium]
MGVREDKKQKVRAEIISAAVDLFREKGFAPTRVAEIIERVGISEKTFFNYFPSKQAVLDAHGLETGRLYEELLQAQVARQEIPARRRLEETAELMAQALESDRDWIGVVAGQTHLFLGASGAQADQTHATQVLVAELFRQGQTAGEFRLDTEPIQLAEIFTATLVMTSVNWLIGWWEETEPLLERLPHAANLVLDGCAVKSNRSRSGGSTRPGSPR